MGQRRGESKESERDGENEYSTRSKIWLVEGEYNGGKVGQDSSK